MDTTHTVKKGINNKWMKQFMVKGFLCSPFVGWAWELHEPLKAKKEKKSPLHQRNGKHFKKVYRPVKVGSIKGGWNQISVNIFSVCTTIMRGHNHNKPRMAQMNQFIIDLNIRRDKLYSTLLVLRGTKDKRFIQYLREGDEAVYQELLKDYPDNLE